MAQIPAIDLDSYHSAVVSAIKNQFPIFQTVEDYPEDRKPLTTPACLIEIEEMDGDDAEDPGTEQQAMKMRVVARIILGLRTPHMRRRVRKLAAEFSAFLRFQRFGQPVGEARLIGAYQDAFEPGLDQFEVWRVEWSQLAYFGTDIWMPDDTIAPHTVYVGFAPDIGPAHESDYHQVTP
ncbi:hypothetical protein [Burkholderia alba]|uniref:hypothetical protein n=1 Tax=Burkholderia alba TaxID=2683677 RepID=UPI002B056596|nr:hypothetical protein [Burkholderia alba]